MKSQGALGHVVIVIVRIPIPGSPLLPSFIISTCPSLHQRSVPGTYLSRPFSSVAYPPPFILLPCHIPSPQPHIAMRTTTARTYLLANLRLTTDPSMVAAEVYGSRRTKQSRSRQRSAPRLQTAPDRLALGSCNDG